MLMTGTKVTHVPYKGTPEAIGDTIAGRVCCYFAPITAAVPHVNGGKAVALGGLEREALARCCPTCRRSRSPGCRGSSTTCGSACGGRPACPPTSPPRSTRTCRRALASPDVKERLEKLGAEPMQMTITEFTQFVRAEVAESQRIIQAAGIKPQ